MSAWDRLGHPLVSIGGGVLIHALPVTVYHIERYVWTAGSTGIDVDSVLPAGRPDPDRVVKGDLIRLWATGLTLPQADDLAAWLGGRVPLRSEWRSAQTAPGRSAGRAPHGDARIGRLVHRLSASSWVDAGLPAPFGEFTTDRRSAPRGRIRLVSNAVPEGVVTMLNEQTYRSSQIGFRCVFDDAADGVVRG
jgi:hypothetical protein